MAKYIAGDKLSAKIKTTLGALGKVNVDLHLVACSAMALAIEHGRANWLNELHAGLPRAYQDALRAWAAPNSELWHGKAALEADNNMRWLKFESKPSGDRKVAQGFHLGKGAVRPEMGKLDAVADDISKAFFAIGADKASKTNSAFDLNKFVEQFATLAAKYQTLIEEEKIVAPVSVITSLNDVVARVKKDTKLKVVVDNTVDANGKPSESEKLEIAKTLLSAAQAEKATRKTRDAAAKVA